MVAKPDSSAMLTGDVRRLTLRMAWPSLTAMLATGLCTLLDALLMARFAPQASAAVSVCFPLLTAQQAAGFTLGMGAGSHVSRSLGASERESAQRVAATALFAALLLGAALCALGLLLLRPLLTLLGADEATLPDAVGYARWLLLCAPASCTGLVLSSLLRGQGRTKANMAAYGAASLLGAALSFLLIPRQGARGAGVSVFAREGLALMLLAGATYLGRGGIRPRPREITLRWWVVPAVLRSGLPTLLRQGMMSVSGMLVSRVSAGFGPAALSGMGIAVRAGALISSAAIGFGQGFAPVCGFNYGAGRMDRIREAYAFCLRVLVLALLAAGAAGFFFADALLRLFDAEPAVAAFAGRVLRAQSVVFFAQGAVILMNMLTQAMGKTVRATLVATSRQGIMLLPLLFLLPRLFGETGLVLCQSVADVLALGFSWLVTRGALRATGEEAAPASAVDNAGPVAVQ